MILYSADTARSCLRRSESCCTVRPRYSVSTTVFTPSSRDRNSATASTFACVGTVGSSALDRFLEQVRDRLRVDRHARDRKSTRLNSSHLVISYAVFCLKKKKKRPVDAMQTRTSLSETVLILCVRRM